VVITSTGTGAGNAAGSLIEAWSAGVPLLHITGEVASKTIGTGRGYIHECKDQLQMLKSISKEAYRLRIPSQTSGLFREAIKKAYEAPSGPISIEVPIDYQSAIIPDTAIIDEEVVPRSLGEKTFNIPDHVVELINGAKRPVLWVGNGALLSGASEEIKQLAELLH